MKITLVKATAHDKETIQNLGRFYVYEMSRYCGFLPGWETPKKGLFECIDLSPYCEKQDRHAFLIHVDGELAGFVLINKIGSTPEVDWNIGEFFVVSKFQGKGVGRFVATQVLISFRAFGKQHKYQKIKPRSTFGIKLWPITPMVNLKRVSKPSQNPSLIPWLF